MRVYLDACTIIYLVEAASPFHEIARTRIVGLLRDQRSLLMTSHLSRLECRVGPLRARDSALLERYEQFFSRRRVTIAEVSGSVIDLATDLRVKYELRTPDAIHLATALVETSDVFVTGDKTFARCGEIHIEVLTDIAHGA